ncbi:MAG: hypothetical protein V3S29_13895, partial [bacterium]
MPERTASAPTAPRRLFAASALGFVALAMVLLALFPGPAAMDGSAPASWWPHPAALVHLVTLGGLLGGFFAIQGAIWEHLYGRAPVGGRWLDFAIWGFYAGGVAIMAAGLLARHTFVTHLGGHYLVPTAIFLAALRGMVTAARRQPGRPAHLAAHLPTLGLLAAMARGALLVMDAYTGQYGIYHPATILVHLLCGIFLFFFPLAVLLDSVADPAAAIAAATAAGGESLPPAGAAFSSTTVLFLPAAVAAFGVMGVAVALTAPAWRAALPAGVGLLGGLSLWWGLPLGAGAPGWRRLLATRLLARLP